MKEIRVCKYCNSQNIRKIIKKGKGLNKGKIIIAEYDYCNECFYKIRKKVPLTFTKEYLYEHAILLKKTFKQIAEENNIKISSVIYWAKKYNIKEILRCKYCGSFENLIIRKIKNQFKEVIIHRNVCKDCVEIENEKRRNTIKSNYDPKKRKLASKKQKIFYKNNPEKKKEEIDKKKETWENKSEDEMQIHSNAVKDALNRRTLEEKKAQSIKIVISRKKNGTDRNYHANIGKTAQEFFVELDKEIKNQGIKYKLMIYGISENGKVIRKERCISVRDISKVAKARFLDCYIEIDKRQINFEFDDYNHNIKNFNSDLLREQEILIKKPKLEIYRIKEKYVNKNRNQVIKDLISIIINKDSKTYFNYASYIELQKIA